MGLMTFDQIVDEVALNIGDVNDPTRLNRWVNWGLQDLYSYLKLDESKIRASFPVVMGTFNYNAPTDLIGVVTIEVGGTKLKRMHRELARGEVEGDNDTTFTPAKPEFYLRRGAEIIIWPTPDQNYDGYIEYIQSPALWSAGVTSLPAHFDIAIVRLATSHGFLAKGNDAKADSWLNSAIRYINSRLTDKDFSKDNPQEGLQVAWDHDDLGVRNPPHVPS